jgi:hypothetical protein
MGECKCLINGTEGRHICGKVSETLGLCQSLADKGSGSIVHEPIVRLTDDVAEVFLFVNAAAVIALSFIPHSTF